MRTQSPWISEGLVAGLMGYVTVVILFGFINLASGEALFHTCLLYTSDAADDYLTV